MLKSQKGTVLVELLIILSIMGILASFVSGDSENRNKLLEPAEPAGGNQGFVVISHTFALTPHTLALTPAAGGGTFIVVREPHNRHPGPPDRR